MADAVGDVILRSPAQQAHRAIDAGIGAGDVAGPRSGLTRVDRPVGDGSGTVGQARTDRPERERRGVA
jgi:hypothetical protein